MEPGSVCPGDVTVVLQICNISEPGRSYLTYTALGPAERAEGGGDVVEFAETRDEPYSEMDGPLQPVQAGFGGTTPD